MQQVLEKKEIYRIKQQQNDLKEMLGGETYRGIERIFNQHTLAWLVVVVTVFLQLISLATTYEGSRVYFGGIVLPLGLSASVLFALAIQSIVFTISHLIRRYFKVWLAIILSLATLCSTYFSYIGIYNHINPPVDYLKERYTQLYDKLNNQYILEVDRSTQEMRHAVFDLMGELSVAYNGLVKEAEENKEIAELIASVEYDTQRILPQINSVARPNAAIYGEDVEGYYRAMREYNAAVSDMIRETTEQDAQLQQTLYTQKIAAYLGGRSQEMFLEESMMVEISKEQLEKTIERMYTLMPQEQGIVTTDEKLEALQMYCLNFITYAEGDKEAFATILNNFTTIGETYVDAMSFEDFKEQLGAFMLLREEQGVLLATIDEVMASVYQEKHGTVEEEKEIFLVSEEAMLLHTKMQAELSHAVHQLNQMHGVGEKIDLTSEEYALYNLYILPLKNLIIDGEIREMAWFCLGFAILIDGLTLLFALMQGKEKNLLFVKNNKQITEHSKARIEVLLLTTIMEHYVDEADENVVEGIRAQLRRFLHPFKLMPEGVENGYSMITSLDKLEEYSVFVAVLCQFNLAVLMDGEELSWLQGDEKAVQKKYILIKTKFILWAKQRIADLALKESYLEEVKQIKYPIQVRGEVG